MLLTVLYFGVLGPFALVYQRLCDPLHLKRRRAGNWTRFRAPTRTSPPRGARTERRTATATHERPRPLLLLPRLGSRPREERRAGTASAEERFSRKKHDSGFPELAIEFCLERGGIGIDVDYVVFYEKPFVKFERMLLTAMATFPRSAAVFKESMQRWISDSSGSSP